MNNIAIIYKSNYGSTETYAKWLAQELGADLLQTDRIKPADLQKYQTIVYGGGLYAGGVNGLGLLTKNFECIKDKRIYIFTVGAADVTDPENTNAIRNSLEKTLPSAMWEAVHIYHLRGGMYYSKMSFAHRTMMNMMVRMLRKKPESELCNDEIAMISTFGQDTDFTDRTTIAPLVADIKAYWGEKTQ